MHNRKRLSGLLLSLLVALVLFLAVQRVLQRMAPVPVQGTPVLSVETLTLAPSSFSVRARYAGSVVAGQTARIPAQVGARVVQIYHREGEWVEEGALLIRLDDRELRNEILRLRANEQRLQAELDFWVKQNLRNETLWEREIIPESQLDNSRRMESSLRASIMENSEALANAKIRQGYTQIEAPFSGQIQELMTEVGGLSIPLLEPLVELVSMRNMKAVIPVPQADLGKLKIGLPVSFWIPAANLMLETHVEKIYPALDPVTRNATFEACLTCQQGEASGVLYPGMEVEATVVLGHHEDALTLPHHALLRRSDSEGVFLFVDGTARWRPVRSGAVAGGRVWIRSGLEAGEQVIVTPDPRLKEGLAVAVSVPGEDASP